MLVGWVKEWRCRCRQDPDCEDANLEPNPLEDERRNLLVKHAL